jgi:hypothetical protein
MPRRHRRAGARELLIRILPGGFFGRALVAPPADGCRQPMGGMLFIIAMDVEM